MMLSSINSYISNCLIGKKLDLTELARRFSRSKDGVGAIEFAMIVPTLLILYVGALEISVAISVDKKVIKANSVAADLISQGTAVSVNDLNAIHGVAKSITAPFDASESRFEVVGIAIDSKGVATAAWSWDETGNAPYAKDAKMTLPSGMNIPNTFLIRTQFDMPYRLIMLSSSDTEFDYSTLNLDDMQYLFQRDAEYISCSDCPT